MGNDYTNFSLNSIIKDSVEIIYPKKWLSPIVPESNLKAFDELIELFKKFPKIQILKEKDIKMPCTLQEIIDIHHRICLYEGFNVHKKLFNYPNSPIKYQSRTLIEFLDAGSKVTEQEYQTALTKRAELQPKFLSILKENRVVITPTVPDYAPKKEITSGDPRLCTPWSLFGFPSICFPVRIKEYKPNELLNSIQLVAKPNEENHLLKTARQINICMLEYCVANLDESTVEDEEDEEDSPSSKQDRKSNKTK